MTNPDIANQKRRRAAPWPVFTFGITVTMKESRRLPQAIPAHSQPALLLNRTAFRLRCQLPNQKFLKQIAGGGSSNPNQPIVDRQLRALAILRRIVDVGNPSRG